MMTRLMGETPGQVRKDVSPKKTKATAEELEGAVNALKGQPEMQAEAMRQLIARAMAGDPDAAEAIRRGVAPAQ